MAEVEAPGPGAPAAADHRRLVRVPPAAGLRRVPPDRGRGGRLPDGGHGALRRAGRGRAAPVPGPARPRHDLHHAQDPRRAARRDHPVQRRRRSPRRSTPRCSPASRAARWSTSSPARRWRSRSPRPPEFRERQERVLAGARILAERLVQPDVDREGDQRALRRHRRAPGPGGPARLRAGRPGGRGPARTQIGITVNRNAVPFDPRPPMVTSGLRIGTPALATRGFGDGGLRRGRRHHRRGADRRRRRRPDRPAPPGGGPRRRPPALPLGC